MNSRGYAKTRGLRGSCPLLIIHNRMGLQNRRIELSWKLLKQCFMIKIFLCIFGLKLPEQWCMYRTTPHRVLENKTSEEVFSGKKPEVSHLRIFGYPVYIHIPKEKRTNLDPSGKKGIFLGYSERSKAYKICFPGFKKINISRDVTFDEDSTYINSRKIPVEDSEESKVPRICNTTMNKATLEEDQEIEEPQGPVDPP